MFDAEVASSVANADCRFAIVCDGLPATKLPLPLAAGALAPSTLSRSGLNEVPVRAPPKSIVKVLLLTSFRREALFLPDEQLGRWAVAARVWPAVREARSALVARIVHDTHWAEHLDKI